MTTLDIGRVCVKLTGREAGKRCIIVDRIDKNFVLITGPQDLTGVKRRRSNINHLEPLEEKIKIKRGASDETVIEVLKTADKIENMKQTSKSEVSP